MTVLLTSASRKIPLLRAVAAEVTSTAAGADAEVVAGDADPRCLASYAWDRFWAMPRLDAVPPRELVAAIAEQGITRVIPTRDADVLYFSEQGEILLAAGIQAMTSPPDAVRTCIDKVAFAQRLVEAGLPTPATATSPDDVDASRLVVKERRGAGSAGAAIDVSRSGAIDAASRLRTPIVQAFVEGREVSIDCYRAQDGRLLGTVARTRDLVIGGESQVSTTIDSAPYRGLVSDLLDLLDVRGHSVVQVIDASDGPCVIECNARLGGASTLALAAGLHSVGWFLLEADGVDPASLPFTPSPEPLRLVRVPQDVIGDPRP